MLWTWIAVVVQGKVKVLWHTWMTIRKVKSKPAKIVEDLVRLKGAKRVMMQRVMQRANQKMIVHQKRATPQPRAMERENQQTKKQKTVVHQKKRTPQPVSTSLPLPRNRSRTKKRILRSYPTPIAALRDSASRPPQACLACQRLQGSNANAMRGTQVQIAYPLINQMTSLERTT